jgi:hypothetical protein
MLSGEATSTNFIVFGLTRPGLEPTIYRTRGEHANHYTTDAVKNTERVFKNGQSRETGNTGYTRRKKAKQKHNTLCVGHHYKQTQIT